MAPTTAPAQSARERDAAVVAKLDDVVDTLNAIIDSLPDGVTSRQVEEAKHAVVQAANKIHRSHGR